METTHVNWIPIGKHNVFVPLSYLVVTQNLDATSTLCINGGIARAFERKINGKKIRFHEFSTDYKRSNVSITVLHFLTIE